MNKTGLHCHAAFVSVLGKLIWIELGETAISWYSSGKESKTCACKAESLDLGTSLPSPCTQFVFHSPTTELEAEKVPWNLRSQTQTHLSLNMRTWIRHSHPNPTFSEPLGPLTGSNMGHFCFWIILGEITQNGCKIILPGQPTKQGEYMTFWFSGTFEKHVLAWLKIKSKFSLNQKRLKKNKIPIQIFFN